MEKRKTILIVEDDADLRRLYKLTLTFDGFDVHEASDGIEALVYIEQHRPDLVILDLGLPKLDGLSVQQEIAAHAITRDIPIVIVTSLDADLAHVDVPCILRKPITPEQLSSAVLKCLKQGAPGLLS